MSGHSKWSQIKRSKGAADARRGAVFTKLGREIAVAARQGGGDPAANFRLRLAVQRARDANMPADTIDRAIKRAVGGGEAESLAEVMYEGYGPGGIAILVEAMTDNRNRTAASIRSIFDRGGGNLGESGSVAWQFKSRGVISISAPGKEEEVELAAIDAGAIDVQSDDGEVQIYTEREELEAVRRALSEAGFEIASAELSMVPDLTVDLDEARSATALKLLDKLENDDDVQKVYTNAEFAVAAMAAFNA
ncbi:MAG TPA: YebC/PmpR family DNA-binding transcriptional regulator [Dehalococcoidia bacterium]|nr:YebC/PmpR family DNA-binding transcriptional regulator [Dehalococcoidia bacterium]